MMSHIFHTVASTIDAFITSIKHRQFQKLLDKYQKNNAILSNYSDKELRKYLDELGDLILQQDDVMNLQILRSHVYKELLVRGVDIGEVKPMMLFLVLTRWAYLNKERYPKLNTWLEKEIEKEREGYTPHLADFYVHLLTNQALSYEDWLAVVTFFSNQYSILYRQQGRFIYTDSVVIPTDMDVRMFSLFKDPPPQDSAYAAVKASMTLCVQESQKSKECTIEEIISETLHPHWQKELQKLNQWITTLYPNPEIECYLDFLTNPASTLRILFDMGDRSMDVFDQKSIVYDEENLVL